MSLMPSRPGFRRLRDRRGFTLVELLVGMAAGMVVATGLFTILDVTLRQTTRTFSRVDATQRARTTLDRIENEMHSACVENKTIPIYQGSTANSVKFWSQYGKGVSLTPVLHSIDFSTAAGGTLTDTVYPLGSGEAPLDWAPAGTSTSSETLLTNVAQSGSNPVFQYFSSDNDGQHPQVLGSGGLSQTQSVHTTEVEITLVVKPAGGSNEDVSLVPNTVTNSVLLRLTPFPNPGTPNQDFDPCE